MSFSQEACVRLPVSWTYVLGLRIGILFSVNMWCEIHIADDSTRRRVVH